MLFSNGLAVVSFITAGLILTTNAKLQAHGHQHGGVFGRIVHKSKASSGSSLTVTTLGGTNLTGSVAVISTATGTARPHCFGETCESTNSTKPLDPSMHPTPVPQFQVQTLQVQDGHLSSLPSRRQNRSLVSQYPSKDIASPITGLGPASTGTMLVKTSDIAPGGVHSWKAGLEVQGELKDTADKEAEIRSLSGFDVSDSHPIGYASSSVATRSTSTTISSSSTAATTSALSPTQSTMQIRGAVPRTLGDYITAPKVAGSHLQGPSHNSPSSQYLNIEAPKGITLAKTLLTTGVNGDLSTSYAISSETGVLELNASTQSYLSPLTETPHLSRDGGKGGMLNGDHLFIFCDTGSYSPPTSTVNGKFLGFVSSSVAIDLGMNGLSGKALRLQDGIGEWSDNVGRMRGFAPLTKGEVAYNEAVQGNGQRYAIWPESSIIPLNATTGIIYAPIIYDNVNMATKAAVFTYTGSALLTITAGGNGGPVAERSVKKIFNQDEVEWGCAGGLRSWGASGVGGHDGKVYLFGIVASGILVARTSPASIGDRDSFEYWDGDSWSSDMPSSSSTAYFIEGAFMDVDVFYSPRHMTFIIVYMTAYADNTFYYRYLQADQGILPPFAPGGDSSSDYVENILKYSWSEQELLYKASPGLSGKYIYSGGVHLGYYGSSDIINGGTKLLLSWTAPTGLDPSTPSSEYQIVTAEVDFV